MTVASLPSAGTIGAYVLVTAGALLRLAAPLGLADYRTGLEIAGAAWICAFAIFLGVSGPMLFSPRVDDKL